MYGWTGNILRVNLTAKSFQKESFDEEFAKKWLGGRGFAIKTLWDELKPGTDPLGPDNKLIIVVGPISGIPAPNTGKTVVAAKSPLTGGYGDGNLGTRVSDHLKKAGYDMIIVEGAAENPVYIYLEDDKVEFIPAQDIWGKGTYESMDWLYSKHGRGPGVLIIGQGGENKVLYSMIRSMEGRAGGRPGMGAVMGSKNLKAIVVKGTKKILTAEPEIIKEVGISDLRTVQKLDKETGWSRQSTTAILAWCNEMAALPVRNMRKTSHKDAWRVDGERLDQARIATYGCPNCTMHCGIAIHDKEGHESELDYENIGMLGPNLEIFDLQQVGSLNYLCDDFGLDTISAGAVLAFYADAIDNGAAEGDFSFGEAEKAKELLRKTSYREGVGDLLALGTRRMADKFGNGSDAYAMHVKGLEMSAYNCKYCPGMALAFGTSSIGAHHKESWIIAYEINELDRSSYGIEKAKKVIELQRIRGGLFETIVSCRFPWIELGWDIEHYPDYFNKITGLNFNLENFWTVADRLYSLIRAFWVREFPDWNRKNDFPPRIWFDPANADKEGLIAGKYLEGDKYNQLLDHYYKLRSWDSRGIP
ncbi:aldehyde ferredoxin oxidoreductase family protein, partial [Acidobacteriota bacterium]